MSSLSKSIDGYWEYHRIVGDDDGGKTFSPEEYERYKREKLPQRLQNRMFVSWSNANGMDCKLVGPETPCFCTHRYRQHLTDFKVIPTERPILMPCRERGCPCRSYLFVPANIRCSCKHMTEDHKAVGNLICTKSGCKCDGFKSSYTCACMEPFNKHLTLVETEAERRSRGMPVGQKVPYQAMGGITGFSSMLDGYARLDDSGRGRLSQSKLDAPITSSDHPFLRAHQAVLETPGNLRSIDSTSNSSGSTYRSRSKSEATKHRSNRH